MICVVHLIIIYFLTNLRHAEGHPDAAAAEPAVVSDDVPFLLQNLFRTLINSVPPSLNILMLMSLLYSLYAILGMQIFGEVPLYVHLSEFGQTQTFRQSNFHGFYASIKMLFECSAGKDWKIVMYEVGDGAWGESMIASISAALKWYWV